MEVVKTKYGELKKAILSGTYDNGEPEGYILEEENIITVGDYTFVPLYGSGELRRKELPQIKFYKNGNIKSLALLEPTKITTNMEEYEAEKISFYEEGEIKRIFPLDGRISGYWTEEDEEQLAKIQEFKFPFGDFKAKVMILNFYKNKKLKSLTFWPKERVELKLLDTKVKVRIGVSFYESGKIASCEPSIPTIIGTPIGNIESYDKNAIGIHGDDNSLKYYEDGSIKSIITSTNIIKVHGKDGQTIIHAPKEVRLYSNSEVLDTITVLIEFIGNKVIIDKKCEYDLLENTFVISNFGEKKLTLNGDL